MNLESTAVPRAIPAWLIALGLSALASGAQAQVNWGFETGDKTGWSWQGAWDVVTSHAAVGGTPYTYTAAEGTYFARMAGPACGRGETTFLTQNVDLVAGQVLAGSAAFDSADAAPSSDAASVQLWVTGARGPGGAPLVLATFWTSNVSDVGDFGHGPWESWSFTAPDTDRYTLSFVVTNSPCAGISYGLFDGPMAVTDADGDGVPDSEDACPGHDDGADADADGTADGCDACPADAENDADADGVCGDADQCLGDDAAGDSDGDGSCDDVDSCPLDAENDADADGVCGDTDQCLGDDASGDHDGDQICDDGDLCTGNDASGDSDGDGYCDGEDNCPLDVNDQADADADGIGDACEADGDGDGTIDDDDNCPGEHNESQQDADADGLGDACDDDDDQDGVGDAGDNCPLYANADQADGDADGLGDACDGDDDADGVSDDLDVCPGTPINAVFDERGCSGAQIVELECGMPGSFGNHGRWVACVVQQAVVLHRSGLISRDERAVIIRSAAQRLWGIYRSLLLRFC